MYQRRRRSTRVVPIRIEPTHQVDICNYKKTYKTGWVGTKLPAAQYTILHKRYKRYNLLYFIHIYTLMLNIYMCTPYTLILIPCIHQHLPSLSKKKIFPIFFFGYFERQPVEVS